MNTTTNPSNTRQIANAFAALFITSLSMPSTVLAADVADTNSAPMCSTVREVRHYGPPGKGVDHVIKTRKCTGVESPAFEAANTRGPQCPTMQGTRHYGAPGKGFDKPSVETHC